MTCINIASWPPSSTDCDAIPEMIDAITIILEELCCEFKEVGEIDPPFSDAAASALWTAYGCDEPPCGALVTLSDGSEQWMWDCDTSDWIQVSSNVEVVQQQSGSVSIVTGQTGGFIVLRTVNIPVQQGDLVTISSDLRYRILVYANRPNPTDLGQFRFSYTGVIAARTITHSNLVNGHHITDTQSFIATGTGNVTVTMRYNLNDAIGAVSVPDWSWQVISSYVSASIVRS